MLAAIVAVALAQIDPEAPAKEQEAAQEPAPSIDLHPGFLFRFDLGLGFGRVGNYYSYEGLALTLGLHFGAALSSRFAIAAHLFDVVVPAASSSNPESDRYLI